MNITHESVIKFRKTGWRIWYFQQILLFIPLSLLIINFQMVIGAHQPFDNPSRVLGGIINTCFYLAYFFDLFAVFLICISLVLDFLLHRKEKNTALRVILIPFFGMLWIALSFLWRFPFYIRGIYDFGFGLRSIESRLENTIYTELLYNQTTQYTLICSSIILILFLLLYDIFLRIKGKIPDSPIDFYPGTLFGFVNCISNFFSIWVISLTINDISRPPFSFLTFLLLFPALILKLLIVPLLGIRTAKKYLSFMGMQTFLIDSISFRNCKDSLVLRFRSSKRTIGIIVILTLLMFTLPFSPLFFMKLFPSSETYEAYITRTADDMEILQYVETLSLYEITEIPPRYYLMTNSTLEYFLKRISSRTISFQWFVSLKNESRILGSSLFDRYWNMEEEEHYEYLIWWSNSTRYCEVGLDQSDIEETNFSQFTLRVNWVYTGFFVYDEVSGPLAALYLEVYQLLFLNEDLQPVCFSFNQDTYYA
ncbi:MAG: hypothetical protein ACFFDT_02420 [Candidatus Hodarchaeota archaeon]